MLAKDGGGVAAIPGQAFDLLVLRPLGVGKLVFGFVAFLPAAIVGQSDMGEVWDVFVVSPFEATFRTPLPIRDFYGYRVPSLRVQLVGQSSPDRNST